MQEIGRLPVTKDNDMKNAKWSYLFAYNLRTIRDIFAYCARKETMREDQLYKDMESFKIPPPKTHWIDRRRKRKERLRLEYVHACEYLRLIKRKNGKVMADLDTYKKEKKTLVIENINRDFGPNQISPPFTDKEQAALARIILSYERARDFLMWFCLRDISKFSDSSESFTLNDFIGKGKPLYILGRVAASKKGSELLKREADNKTYEIPDMYIRLTNYVFSSWFTELGLIDRVRIFPEFSSDKKLWHMLYPLKMKTKEFLAQDLAQVTESLFLKDVSKKSIWIPYLLYVVARKFYCPVKAIKIGLEKLYKEDFSHFYLERTSLQVMKKHSRYKDSYIKVDGFYRSTLKLTKRGEKNE